MAAAEQEVVSLQATCLEAEQRSSECEQSVQQSLKEIASLKQDIQENQLTRDKQNGRLSVSLSTDLRLALPQAVVHFSGHVDLHRGL